MDWGRKIQRKKWVKKQNESWERKKKKKKGTISHLLHRRGEEEGPSEWWKFWWVWWLLVEIPLSLSLTGITCTVLIHSKHPSFFLPSFSFSLFYFWNFVPLSNSLINYPPPRPYTQTLSLLIPKFSIHLLTLYILIQQSLYNLRIWTSIIHNI